MTWFVLVALGLVSLTGGQLVTHPTGRIVALALALVLFLVAAVLGLVGATLVPAG